MIFASSIRARALKACGTGQKAGKWRPIDLQTDSPGPCAHSSSAQSGFWPQTVKSIHMAQKSS